MYVYIYIHIQIFNRSFIEWKEKSYSGADQEEPALQWRWFLLILLFFCENSVTIRKLYYHYLYDDMSSYLCVCFMFIGYTTTKTKGSINVYLQ